MKKGGMKKHLFKKGREECRNPSGKCHHHHDSGGGFFYFLGIVGAAVYYIQTATSFWGGVLGFLKALVWPAFLVYESLKYLLG